MVMIIGVSGGIVGVLMVMRRMTLMGDALAHSLLPGMAIAYLVIGQNPIAIFLGASIAGIGTAVASSLVSLSTRLREDAAFGAFFVLGLALGIALISSPSLNIQVDLIDFLFGNILSIRFSDLWISLIMATITLGVLAIFYRDISIEAFDCDFYRVGSRNHHLIHTGILVLIVINLVSALQALGAILALGLFILPAVSALLWTDVWGRLLLLSGAFAVTGGVSGLLLSYYLSLPSGPGIVLALGCIYIVSLLFGKKSRLISFRK